jgi:rubrerythrin
MTPLEETELERTTLRTFLSSSWFAEDEAAPTVARLLEQPCDEEERRLLLSYAAEENGHAELIARHFETRGLQFGDPFWIQRIFRLARSRPTMLLQMYTVEVLACVFYGAMAARTKDKDAQALIKILLRDEARHIRLTRELLSRELARQPATVRLKTRALAAILRVGVGVTAWVQSRQLRPVLGETGFTFSVKLVRLLSADRSAIFRRAAEPEKSLSWWWRAPVTAAAV